MTADDVRRDFYRQSRIQAWLCCVVGASCTAAEIARPEIRWPVRVMFLGFSLPIWIGSLWRALRMERMLRGIE